MVPKQDVEFLDKIQIEGKTKSREYVYFVAASWLREKISLRQKPRKGSNVDLVNNSVMLAKPMAKVFR